MSDGLLPRNEEEKNVHVSDTHISLRPIETPFILCPLSNLGNTCYFNAGVQLLANCPLFVYGLRNSLFRHPRFAQRALQMCHSGGAASQALFQTFAQLLHEMEFAPLKTGEALAPLRAIDSLAAVHPAFEGRGQQDCSEMVNVVIANISEEGRQGVQLEALLRSFEEDTAAAFSVMSENCNMNGVQGNETVSVPELGTGFVTSSSGNNLENPLREEERVLFYNTSKKVTGHHVSSSSALGRNSVRSQEFPGSWHSYNILKLMRTVNEENEQLERNERARKNEPYRNMFSPPELFYNRVTDGFTGYMLSEVMCHTCNNTSRTVGEFTSLTIDVSSDDQRLQYAKMHPDVKRVDPNGNMTHQKRRGSFQWWNPFAWTDVLTRWVHHLFRHYWGFVDTPVTLKECLDIHFEPVVLKGANKYYCASCNTLSEATKRETLLLLPEYLLIQMKRFEYGICFNTKKTDPVIFPVSWNTGDVRSTEVLRLGDYLHESITKSGTLPSLLSTSSRSEESMMALDKTPISEFVENGSSLPADNAEGCQSLRQDPIDTYTLEAVVNHHGSIGGGHYTTYARKRTESQDMWLYLSDDYIISAELSEVADSEEYLLLYKKQPLQPRSENFLNLRRKALCLLSIPPIEEPHLSNRQMAQGTNVEDTHDEAVVYISRPWLERMAFMEEPGPIFNRLSYSTEKNRCFSSTLQEENKKTSNKKCRNTHGPPVEWFYVSLRRYEYNAFYSMYGGNTAVTQKEYERLLREQKNLA